MRDSSWFAVCFHMGVSHDREADNEKNIFKQEK